MSKIKVIKNGIAMQIDPDNKGFDAADVIKAFGAFASFTEGPTVVFMFLHALDLHRVATKETDTDRLLDSFLQVCEQDAPEESEKVRVALHDLCEALRDHYRELQKHEGKALQVIKELHA